MRYTALSLKQPWAEMVASGLKTIETRNWHTNFRGPLLVCVSQGLDMPGFMWLEQRGHRFGAPSGMVRGVAVCLVTVTNCTRMTKEDEASACCEVYPGAWSWHLADVRRLKEPLPAVKGSLRLFTVELERVVFE